MAAGFFVSTVDGGFFAAAAGSARFFRGGGLADDVRISGAFRFRVLLRRATAARPPLESDARGGGVSLSYAAAEALMPLRGSSGEEAPCCRRVLVVRGGACNGMICLVALPLAAMRAGIISSGEEDRA